MEHKKVYTAIGLMSGTSLDGIDAALIKTDGYNHVEYIESVLIPYEDELRESLRGCLGKKEDPDGRIGMIEIAMTRAHAAAVDWLLGKAGYHPQDIDLIGFHGQTLFHDPAAGFTWQLGNGAMLARLTGINVINDMRSADVAAGGQGAPLLPLYHQARLGKSGQIVAILNIGGVANVTWLGANGAILAFDTGPGNALLDDWVKKHLNRPFDENGMLARQGNVHQNILELYLAHPYFSKIPPKSLDRDYWDTGHCQTLSAADGAATLSELTIQTIKKAQEHFPAQPEIWYVTGGGRHNPVLMDRLAKMLNAPVETVDTLGWNGDSLEAEGFAYLAVRSFLRLPLSLPSTTGGKNPVTGGRFHKVHWEDL
ncbi:MAG: anhydro-N-acetylmuramic acid kinase [Alphaproteobacteria bacterium CG_4_9_14_3_um_filter_47_13]|nr:MAG: anhydro-N-acetylmuramic acid kinase [Alphaproteobacteria bacterium CG_4_9_14_3_um_filter_47_13]